MLTFKQFLNEANHSAGNRVHDWGVIHPHTGALISAQKHPFATTHEKFKQTLNKTHPNVPSSHYADYIHYTQHGHGLTTQVRSHNPEQHKALQKGIKNLPISNHYEHGQHTEHGMDVFHDFDNEKQLHKHVNSLIN